MGDVAGVVEEPRTARCVLGIDVGGTSMKGALVGEDGEPVTEAATRPTKGDAADDVLDRVLDFVSDVMSPTRRGAREVAAIGLGVPGIVDEGAGIGVQAVNLGWRNVPLRERITKETGLPTVVGHDVRSAAVGEQLYGAARGLTDFLFVAIGTGVGAASVINGAPYAGPGFAGGEFGHMVIDASGPECPCGRRGCIEAIASARAIERHYADRAADGEQSRATDLPARIDAGDEVAQRVWSDAVAGLALGILNYVTLLDPQAVVIGGGLASAGPRLIDPLREAIHSGLLSFQPRRPVLLGALGATAGWRGAAARAWELARANLDGGNPGA